MGLSAFAAENLGLIPGKGTKSHKLSSVANTHTHTHTYELCGGSTRSPSGQRQAFRQREHNEGDGTHSSTLAWKTPWVEEPGGLQSMGSRRVGHD